MGTAGGPGTGPRQLPVPTLAGLAGLAAAAAAAALGALGAGRWRRGRDPATQEGLAVGESGIEGGGKGLFAARAFRQGEVLCYYTGAQIKIADMLRKSRKGPQGTAYVMGFGLNKYLDAEFRPDVLARYLNDSKDKRRYNVYFNKRWELRRAEVVALRDIAPGEELFVSYRANYWKVDGRQLR